MNIIGTQYTLQNKAFEIYIAGCSGETHCVGCHNPESWDFNLGEEYNSTYQEKINKKVKEFDSLIDSIMIFGGEPNDNNLDELKLLLSNLALLNKPIWLFTRYEKHKLPQFEFELCDYIKCGRYIEELKTESNIQHGIKLATSNQAIYKKGLDY